ncbi:MAG TPA: hypothetical protein VGX00_02030 [Thermoplasmata archaeon]|nr:hypothetical protein [Thermoplasmata archaeon]
MTISTPLGRKIAAGELAIASFVVVGAVCYIARSPAGVTVVAGFPIGWWLAPREIIIKPSDVVHTQAVLKGLLRFIVPDFGILVIAIGVQFATGYPLCILAAAVGLAMGGLGGFMTRTVLVARPAPKGPSFANKLPPPPLR